MIEQNRNFSSKPRDFLKKQGFYIVLFVCLLIVGTAIVLTTLPQETADTPDAAANTENPVVIETRQSADEALRAKNTPLPTATPAPTAAPTPMPTSTPKQTSSGGVKSVKKGASPLDGEIIWGYAGEHLIYSRTLDQWTTHPAVDIAGELGTPVAATLAGTVEKVYEDDALGHVVTITHTNGRTSLYGNLDPSIGVTAGQKVNAGDVLGKIGSSAMAECSDLPHLHFAFLVDGKPVDPMEYVTIPH